MRFVMITHHNDGVARFGPGLIIQSPDWLGHPARRWREIPKGMRWMPITTFFQVLVDMKNSANVVPGVFAATGHDYRADLLPFFRAVLGIEVTDDQMQRLAAWLEQREVVRSQWVKKHKTADKSLAASLRGLDARRPGTSEPDDHRTHEGDGARGLRRGRRCGRRRAGSSAQTAYVKRRTHVAAGVVTLTYSAVLNKVLPMPRTCRRTWPRPRPLCQLACREGESLADLGLSRDDLSSAREPG